MTRRNGLLLAGIGLMVSLLVYQVDNPIGLKVPTRVKEVPSSDGRESGYRRLKSERHFMVEVNNLLRERVEVNNLLRERVEGRKLVWVEVGDDPTDLVDGYPKGLIQFHTRPIDPLLTSTTPITSDSGWKKLTRQRIPGNLVMGMEDYWYQSISTTTTTKEEEREKRRRRRIGSTLTVVYEVPDTDPLSSAPITWLRTYYFDWSCPSDETKDPAKEEEEGQESPFPYRELRLPGSGTVTSLTIVDGTLTYSREGDRYLFWTGELPIPTCNQDDDRMITSYGLINLMRGPPTSHHYPSRSQYASRTLQAHSFHRLKSYSQEDHFTVLMANFKWGETDHVAEVKSWSYPGTTSPPSPLTDTPSEEDEDQLKNITSPHWKRKTLLRLEIPNYLDSPRDLVESLTQTTLLDSLSHHLIHHTTLPTPHFASLHGGEAVVIFPYRSIATLIRYCTTQGSNSESTHLVKALSFESVIQESIDPRTSTIYPHPPRSQFNLISPHPYPSSHSSSSSSRRRRRRRSSPSEDKIFQRLTVTSDGHLLSLQSGDHSLILFNHPPPSPQTSDLCSNPNFDQPHLTPHYLLQPRDLPTTTTTTPILASSFHSYRSIEYLILLHPDGALTTWSLQSTPTPTSPLSLDRLIMFSAMAIVILLFVVNEFQLPPA